MLRSILIGLVAGSRSMTPLAAVALAQQAGRLPRSNGAEDLLRHRAFTVGAVAMAVGELLGDKMKTAPDRIVPAGIAARLATGAIAGAAVAPKSERVPAAVLGAAAAVVASYVTFDLRMRALTRYGQTPSGLVEDALTVGSAVAVLGAVKRR